MLPVGDRPPLRIELSRRPLGGPGTRQIPGLSGLYCAAGSRILGCGIVRIILPGGLLRTQAETHIRGQPLEQCASIPRLVVLSFFGLK